MFEWKKLDTMVHLRKDIWGKEDDESEAEDYESEAENFEFRGRVIYYLHVIKTLCNFKI